MSTRVDDLVSIALDIEVLAHAHSAKITLLGKVVTYIEEPLIDQLKDKAGETGSTIEGGNANGRPVTAKMPAAQEGAFSLFVEIETKAAQITKWLGASGTSRTVADNLDWIYKEIDNYDDDAIHLVAKTIAELRYRTEVELNKVDPPRALNAKCPECNASRSVRVFFRGLEIEKVECQQCDAIWGPGQLGELNTLMNKENA